MTVLSSYTISLHSAESKRVIVKARRAKVVRLQNMMSSRYAEVVDVDRQTQVTPIRVHKYKVLKKFWTFSKCN